MEAVATVDDHVLTVMIILYAVDVAVVAAVAAAVDISHLVLYKPLNYPYHVKINNFNDFTPLFISFLLLLSFSLFFSLLLFFLVSIYLFLYYYLSLLSVTVLLDHHCSDLLYDD